MNAAQARALLFKRQLNIKNVDISLSGLPELDGQLAILELRGTDTSHADKLAEGPDGTTDEILMMAALVCKGLVMRDTKERVFNDTDLEGVAAFGLTILKPFGELVAEASGLDAEALANAKKNSRTNQGSDSSTLSQGNLVEASLSQS